MEGYRGLGQTVSLYPVPPQALIPQPEPTAYEFDTPRGLGLGQTQIARGIQAAYGGAKAGLQGYGASIADALGAQQLAQEWYANANANAQQAELDAPRVRTIGAIQNPNDALDYALGKVGEVAPYLIAGGGLGLLGRGVGAAAGLRGAQLARAGHLTAATGFQPVMAGDQALAMHNDPAAQGMSPLEILTRSQGVGAAQAYIDTAVPNMMVGQLLTRSAAPTIARTLGTVARNSAASGLAEGAQDVIGQMHRGTYDPSYQYNPVDTGEAIAAGVVGTAPIAGVHGAITHGLDKGAGLPDKVAEASKTEAQRLYDAAIDVIPDEVKDYVKRSADYVVQKDQDAGAYWDEHLAPEFEAAGTVGAAAKALFFDNVKATAQELNAARQREGGTSFAEVEGIVKEAAHKLGQQAGVARKTLSQIYGDTHIGQLLADDPAVPQHVKEDIAAANGADEKLSRIAEAMSDPGKWFEDNLTAEDLKAHKQTLKNPVRQAAFLEDVVFALEEHGQETAAANQIRDLYRRVKGGEALSDADAAAMYITAKLALEAQGTERGIIGATKVFENTRSAQQRTGKTIPGAGEVEGVQYAKSGQSFHENAMQAALSVADTSPELAKDIARRVQLLDIIGDGQRKGRGADIVVREAVSKALTKHGIRPEANRAFTEMYDKVLAAVNERLGELRKEGSIPKEQTAEEIAENVNAFKVRVHEHVDEMLSSTEVGKQLRGSPKIADHVADFVGKLAMGHPDYTQRAATRLFTQMLARFGDAGRGAIDNIIDTADNAFGGDSRAAARVGMLRENVSNLYDVAAAIGKTVKRGGQVEHKSGNRVPNYALIGELLEDLDLTRRVDSKRDAMLASRREALSKRNKSMDFDERERLNKYAKDVADVLSRHGLDGLRERWVGEGIVDAKKFQSLVALVEKYDRHSDRLDRPERRPADHVKAAGRTAENISHEDPEYLQAVQEGAPELSNPITPEEMGGRTGDARDDLIEKRRVEKYGNQGEVKAPARFVGSEIFDTKAYDPKAPKLGAPVTMHAAGERATSYNSMRSEFGAMAEEAHTVYGHALTDARPVRMDAWAEEMANTQGGTPRQHLNNALDALLEHDQRRLASGKLSVEEIKYVKLRAEMAERLKARDAETAGERFFTSSMNRSYRYYRIDRGDNEFLSYSADQLRHGYAVPEGMTGEQYAAREAKTRGPFAPQVYEDSLLPVEFTDGKVYLIDIAKLVHDTMRRHQSADTSGVGDKRITPDKGQQILNAFHTVMGTLITTDGVKRIPHISEEVGKLFVSEDSLGTDGYSQNFDPSLVIYREAVPHKTQVPGEPVEEVSVPNFFTLGQLGRVVGMDAAGKTKFQTPNKMTLPVTDRVRGQQPVGPGVFRQQDMPRIMKEGRKVPLSGLPGQNGRAEPERVKRSRWDEIKRGVALNGLTRVVKEKSYDETGTLVKPFVGDNMAYSVDVHALLARMLERNNIDPYEALVEGNLPLDTAGMLLREAFTELKSMGYDGALFDMASNLFDELQVYTRFQFDKNEPVTLGDLKKSGAFALKGSRRADGAKFPIVTPRTLEDAKLHEVLMDIKATEFDEIDAKRRRAEGARDLSLTSPAMAKLRADRIEKAYGRTEWGLWRDPDSTTATSTHEVPENVLKLQDLRKELAQLEPSDPRYAKKAAAVAELAAKVKKGDVGEFTEIRNPGSHTDAWDYSDAAMALGRLADRLGGTKDIPLQDKAEAVGGDRGVERKNRFFGMNFNETQKRGFDPASLKEPVDFDGTRAMPRGPLSGDVVLKLYDRLRSMNSADPAMTKFLEETFFLKDKGFEGWLEKQAAVGKSELRLSLPQRTTTGRLYTQVSETAPKAGKIAQRRADMQEVERVKALRQGDRLKPNSEPQRSGEAVNVGLGSEAHLSGADAFERAKGAMEMKDAALRARRLEEVTKAQKAVEGEISAPKKVAIAAEPIQKVAGDEPSVKTTAVEAKETKQVDIDAAIKDFSSRAPKSPAEAQSLIKTLSDAQLQEFLLKLPSLTQVRGTVAEQAIRLVSGTTGPLKEWAEAHLERAGVEFDGVKFRKIGETDTPFSKQQGTYGAEVSQQEVDAIAKKLLGDIVSVRLVSSLGVDSDGLKIVGRFVNKSIELARSNRTWEVSSDGSVVPTGGGSRGTLHHEVWHAVEDMLKEMGPHGEKILADIHAHVSTPLMKVWLEKNYNDAGVGSQLDSLSERAAFVFQKLSEGVKMPMVAETKTLLQHLADFVRWVGNKVGFNTTTVKERSDNFMDYVMRGDFARDMDNAASVRKGLGEKNGDDIVHQAGQILKPGLEALSAVFQHTSTRIADLKIPEYDTVMELFVGAEGKGGYINDKRRMEYAFDNELGEQIKGMSEDQMQKFRLEKFVEFQGKVEGYMRDAGVEPHQVERFYRRLATLNADAIGKDIEAFITDLVNHGGFKGKAGEARTLANQIADRGFYYNKDRDLFPSRPDLQEKWSERDFAQSAMRYIQQAVHLAERTRERVGSDGKTYRISDLTSLLEAGNAKADSAGQQLMEDAIAAYEGTLASDKLSPGLRKFMGSLLFINNVRLLPKAVFSQMLEPMQLALRKGSMSGTLDTLWRGIREMPRSFDKFDAAYTPDKWEELANQIGTAPSRIIANVMAQMQNGMTLPGKIGHWNDQFFKLNFMDQWNRSMHVEATKHGVEFLKEHAEIVRAGKNTDLVERSRRYLNELGVKESDIKVDSNGDLFIDVANVGSDRVARAISQYVNEAMAHPDAGSNPMWMNDPRFALLAQMKRFTFAHAKFVLDRGIKEYKLGNAFPLVPAVLAMPWMLAADGLRDTLTLTDTSYKNNWGILDHMEHAWSRAGHAGRGQLFADMGQSIRHGGSGLEGAAGPTAELFGRIARGAHTGAWFDSMVNQVPGAPMIMPD